MVFAFWEGSMPAYIKLCMKTWNFDYVLLNYDTLQDYIQIDRQALEQFTLPQIADYIRVHILRDCGGHWLDTDTIMINSLPPQETIVGNPITRTNTISVLNSKPHQMYVEWAEYQDRILAQENPSHAWNVMGNAFTDGYLKEHTDVEIRSVDKHWAEVYMIPDNITRYVKYQRFYFEHNYTLKDLQKTNMLMLHNSWTPSWYKQLNEQEVLQQDCTLSNILKELL